MLLPLDWLWLNSAGISIGVPASIECAQLPRNTPPSGSGCQM
ncbi:Uncharacterised protein [Serratia marcescens]|nr:Uncharacterised protein [Serratia marcescens]